MNRKLLCLLAAAALMAGCAVDAKSSLQEAMPPPAYTYVNPDPDMVLIAAPGGDVTYADYRLYMDVNEEIGRYTARQGIGIAEILQRDLAGMGVAVDEGAFAQMASENVMMMSLYTPSMAEDLDKVAQASGLSQNALEAALLLDHRLEYLSGLLTNHFYALAAEKYPPAESGQDPQPDAESESPPADAPDPDDEAEQARQQAIGTEVAAMIEQYSQQLNERHSLEDEGVLIAVDGQDIPYSQRHLDYIEYVAASSRVDAAAFVQAGELVLRELTQREVEIARQEFEMTLRQYVEAIREDELFMEHLTRICAKFGATPYDYFKALRHPLWLQYTADVYYNLMAQEYEALPEEAQGRPESIQAYYSQQFNALLEGSETVNIAG
jgi:hypothetical protein